MYNTFYKAFDIYYIYGNTSCLPDFLFTVSPQCGMHNLTEALVCCRILFF